MKRKVKCIKKRENARKLYRLYDEGKYFFKEENHLLFSFLLPGTWDIYSKIFGKLLFWEGRFGWTYYDIYYSIVLFYMLDIKFLEVKQCIRLFALILLKTQYQK